MQASGCHVALRTADDGQEWRNKTRRHKLLEVGQWAPTINRWTIYKNIFKRTWDCPSKINQWLHLLGWVGWGYRVRGVRASWWTWASRQTWAPRSPVERMARIGRWSSTGSSGGRTARPSTPGSAKIPPWMTSWRSPSCFEKLKHVWTVFDLPPAGVWNFLVLAGTRLRFFRN